MDEFNYVFELFALLLGLAVAEMLQGFGQVLKLRARRKANLAHPERHDDEAIKVRIGWMVPLLGLLVLVDLATFWGGLWMVRDGIEMSMLTVFVVLVLIGGYYLVATQVFPDQPERWPDFDQWYALQKRFVVGGVLVINLLAQTLVALVVETPQMTPEELARYPALIVAGLLIYLNLPAMIWLVFSRRRWVDVALIAFVVGTQFFYAWAAIGVEGFE
jgi:hypothetical protein